LFALSARLCASSLTAAMVGDQYPWPWSNTSPTYGGGPVAVSYSGRPEDLLAVKNAFIATVDTSAQDCMRRSASGSDVSESSGEEKMKFWLPSLSSESSSSTSSPSPRESSRPADDRPQPAPVRTWPEDPAFCLDASQSQEDTWLEQAPIGAQQQDDGIVRGAPQHHSAAPLLIGGDAIGPTRERTTLAKPPSDSERPSEELQYASIGSIKHNSGDCSPCLFWFRRSCAKGVHCDYCHFRHKGQRNKRIRPSKKTRMQMRASVEPAGSQTLGPEELDSEDEDEDAEGHDADTALY